MVLKYMKYNCYLPDLPWTRDFQVYCLGFLQQYPAALHIYVCTYYSYCAWTLQALYNHNRQ